ncbi:transcription factor 4-like isoform x7 [Plakobranchus ocellatus]|uniref:Transcription factor 4-like isoform x7 n=1 Tax=Plakobranchus ocellatus TaxID=259542 RepID=A0AAV3YML2_9GAST|nr:transcription factor 4-like isoform x7 [Plakobranchus ocellatus]
MTQSLKANYCGRHRPRDATCSSTLLVCVLCERHTTRRRRRWWRLARPDRLVHLSPVVMPRMSSSIRVRDGERDFIELKPAKAWRDGCQTAAQQQQQHKGRRPATDHHHHHQCVCMCESGASLHSSLTARNLITTTIRSESFTSFSSFSPGNSARVLDKQVRAPVVAVVVEAMFPPYTQHTPSLGYLPSPPPLEGPHFNYGVYSPGPEEFHQDSPRYNSPKPGMYGDYFIDHPPGAANDQWSAGSLPSSFPSSHLPGAAGPYPHPHSHSHSHPQQQQQQQPQQSSYADMSYSDRSQMPSARRSGGNFVLGHSKVQV